MSPFYADLAERAVRTFVQAALSVVAADIAGITSLDTAKALIIAAVAAGISAVMSLVARGVGPADSSSVVVPVEVPVQETVIVNETDTDQDPLF